MNKRMLAVTSAVCLLATPALAREQLRIVGSSSVFPFVAAAAEQFGRSTQFRTPIIEANGTGGGLKMFCDGVGDDYPDIANASRPIKPSETERCNAHGVHNVAEFAIGYDGIVFANARASAPLALSKKTIFLALARQVPKNGKLVENPYTRWNEIDPALPDVEIEVYGPPPAEGTRDAFVELVMQDACKQIPEITDKSQCGLVREDGKFVELLGGNVMVQKLINNKGAVGIFGYSFLDQNRASVKANAVDGVLPEIGTIVSGQYGVARSLYMYVKREHIGKQPGLAEFVSFVLSDAASGDDGFLSAKGLIPQAAKDRAAAQKRAMEIR